MENFRKGAGRRITNHFSNLFCSLGRVKKKLFGGFHPDVGEKVDKFDAIVLAE